MHPTTLRLTVKSSKCDQFRQGDSIYIGPGNTPFCPLASLELFSPAGTCSWPALSLEQRTPTYLQGRQHPPTSHPFPDPYSRELFPPQLPNPCGYSCCSRGCSGPHHQISGTLVKLSLSKIYPPITRNFSGHFAQIRVVGRSLLVGGKCSVTLSRQPTSRAGGFFLGEGLP